jgi:hypothetical protein
MVTLPSQIALRHHALWHMKWVLTSPFLSGSFLPFCVCNPVSFSSVGGQAGVRAGRGQGRQGSGKAGVRTGRGQGRQGSGQAGVRTGRGQDRQGSG